MIRSDLCVCNETGRSGQHNCIRIREYSVNKTLLVMRHAKSSWANEDLDDFDRPLNARGLRDAPRMAKFLVDQQMVPDLIISSTAKRARTTADLVAENSSYVNDVKYSDAFYHGSPADYFRGLRPLPVAIERCMVVGHNPGLERLVEQLSDVYETMPTAAIAVISIDIRDWDEIDPRAECELRELWRPKEVF